MCAEGILSNPYLFEKRHEVNWIAAREYLDFAERYESTISAVRAHLFRMCHHRSIYLSITLISASCKLCGQSNTVSSFLHLLEKF